MTLDPALRVLLVEDDEDVMLTVVALLRRLGVDRVTETTDGEQALAKLAAADFDVVLSDWNMEPMTGIELLRAVRAEPRLAGLPVLLMTAEDSDEKQAAAREAGASAYLVKPFDAAGLEAGLTAALAR